MMLNDPPAILQDRKKALSGGLKVDYLGFILVAAGLGCLQVVLDKGTEDDWLGSNFITIFAIISSISLVALILWELGQDEPIVDLPLMRNRSFAASMLVMFVTGFILISTTQILPQFLQSMLGYTAMKAGLALTAGGVVTLCAAPVAGALIKKIQPKWLITFGLAVEAVACLYLRGFNTDISFGHAAFGRMMQGAGLPFLFVPITTVSYAGLPPGKSNNASALINTMRNLGGSFGISVAVALLARRSQFHQSRLASVITPYNLAVRRHLAGGVGALRQVLAQQVMMLSYIDIFALLAIVAACAIPITFLLKRIKPEEAHAGH
jgi:DHA2 family multidrug resistance protein